MATDSKPSIPDELIDQLLAGYSSPEDLTGKDGILKQLTARLVERALQGEMSAHLGYDKGDALAAAPAATAATAPRRRRSRPSSARSTSRCRAIAMAASSLSS